MFHKIATAQMILRRLHEKQAGIMLPLAAGAALMATPGLVRKAREKSHEYHAGFTPGGHQ